MNAPSAEELDLLRDQARTFTRQHTDHRRLRQMRETLPGHARDVIAQFAGLGWNGVLFPESLGGSATGFSAMGVILEELGRGLIADPLVPGAVLAGRAILHCDNEALKQKLIPGIAEGTITASLAWQERPGTLDPQAIQTLATVDKGLVSLTGGKQFVAFAEAGGFVVSAKRAEDVVLVWVPRDTPGLKLQMQWRADGTPGAMLALDNATVPQENMAGAGKQALERAIDEAAAMACAEMVGVMRAALDITTEYMRHRVQFGKPIGSFQALQHKAVDLFMQQELAAAVAAEAAEVLDREPRKDERTRMIARAKARCNDACLRITRESIQLHGGIGTTDDCDIGLYFKRALTLSAWLGSSPVQRARYAPFTRQECELDV